MAFKKILSFSWGSWLGIVIGVISTPMLTRIFSPEEFGVANMVIMIANFVALVCGMGMLNVFVRYYFIIDKHERHILLWQCLKFPLLLYLFFTILIIFLYPSISSLFFGKCSLWLVISVIILSGVTLVNSFSDYLLRLLDNAKIYSLNQMLSKAINIIFVLFLFYVFGFRSAYSMIFASMFCMIIVTFLGIINAKYAWGFNLKSLSFHNRQLEFFKYGTPFLFASILYYLNSNVDRIILKYFTSIYEVGIYSAAFRVSLILYTVRSAFDSYFGPEVMRLSAKNDATLSMFLINTNKIYAFVLFFIWILIFGFHDGFIYFFGIKYSSTIAVIMLIILDPVLNSLSATYGACIDVAKRSRYYIFISIITCVINVVLNFVFVPIFGLKGCAIAIGSTSVIYIIITANFAHHSYKVDYTYVRTFIMIALLYISGMLALFVDGWIFSSVVTLLLFSILMITYKDVLVLLWHKINFKTSNI